MLLDYSMLLYYGILHYSILPLGQGRPGRRRPRGGRRPRGERRRSQSKARAEERQSSGKTR